MLHADLAVTIRGDGSPVEARGGESAHVRWTGRCSWSTQRGSIRRRPRQLAAHEYQECIRELCKGRESTAVAVMDSDMALQQVKERYLGQTVRIRLTDGRVVEGVLLSLDYLMNFVLGGAIELFGLPAIDASESLCKRWKDVGTAVVPGKHVEAVILRTDGDKTDA